ncbi:MAG: 4Fe-4S dicluster domain-containing protein [Bacteroidales bacterium]
MSDRIAGFVVDLHRCTGCNACVLACRLEHGLASVGAWRRVIPLNDARHPAGPTYFLSVACHHCERPACERSCPTRAYEQRPDGIVVHREERCIGCRYCEMACPFGAPRFDDYRGVMTKCQFCVERIDSGEAPACVAACPTSALRTIGDAAAGDLAVIPGFADPAACKPAVRFKPPRGIRGARLAEFLGSAAKRP